MKQPVFIKCSVVLVIVLLTFQLSLPLYGFFLLQRSAEMVTQRFSGLSPVEREKIVADLEKSVELLVNDPTPLRYLAKAYQLQGRYVDAVAVLEKATSLEPDSILIAQELFLAQLAAGIPSSQLANKLNYNPDIAIKAGDSSFVLGEYEHALLWYSWVSEQWPVYRDYLYFRRIMSAALINEEVFNKLLESPESQKYVFRIDEDGRIISGSDFRWVGIVGWPTITFGSELIYGGFWWNGQASVIVISPRKRLHTVNVTLRNSYPPPVKMAFGVNGKPLHWISLVKGDDSWDTFTFVIDVSDPSITIDLWFLNNGSFEGHDRDAFVKQIEIKPLLRKKQELE
ncbi:MAG: hypothetical protein KatS3mg087_2168 [Patescibacteria group bacterium]|uniref:hypothetical protein n=1 Tax=Chloroflexus sp. TaxID=1904827 RepID=UPI0021DD2C29|nr:hypothetical protein [Chloroflexus sp.]GIV91223.1 MAG: hypothetical protein KatS3mg055_3741 [Chloroflexus sp.]GIW61102.1 MAG: hypothetical protein KatS3mg087_2168 [Patescibacteria group bacterium]